MKRLVSALLIIGLTVFSLPATATASQADAGTTSTSRWWCPPWNVLCTPRH